MTDDLGKLIRTVAPGNAARLADTEEAVWTRIGELGKRAGVGRTRVAAVALALVIGVTNGGLMFLTLRPEPSELRIFTVSAGLSPLAGLDVRG